MGRVIVAGGARAELVNYKSNFADKDWDTIIHACQKNKVPETWVVGSQKSMTIDGTNYAIDIIGKNHDTYSDGSGTAPLTLQLHNCYADGKPMNSSNTNLDGWTGCAMRSTHLPAILALMPSEVQNGIREVNKRTSEGSKSGTIITTKDKLFLLSEIEILGNDTYSFTGEGTQYDYYKAGNSKIKSLNNNASIWLERSPYNDISEFCYIDTDGSPYRGSASVSHGVAFAFCF